MPTAAAHARRHQPMPGGAVVRRLADATACWAVLFAAAHAYWAAGGRVGVPAGAAPISERPWFLAYDIVAGALCVLEAVLLLGVADRLPRLRAWRGTLPLLRVGVVALALRGAVGILGDAVMIAQGDADTAMLFDVWFVLGAVLLATTLRNTARPHRRRKSIRPEPRTTAGPAPTQTTTAAGCRTTVE